MFSRLHSERKTLIPINILFVCKSSLNHSLCIHTLYTLQEWVLRLFVWYCCPNEAKWPRPHQAPLLIDHTLYINSVVLFGQCTRFPPSWLYCYIVEVLSNVVHQLFLVLHNTCHVLWLFLTIRYRAKRARGVKCGLRWNYASNDNIMCWLIV